MGYLFYKFQPQYYLFKVLDKKKTKNKKKINQTNKQKTPQHFQLLARQKAGLFFDKLCVDK